MTQTEKTQEYGKGRDESWMSLKSKLVSSFHSNRKSDLIRRLIYNIKLLNLKTLICESYQSLSIITRRIVEKKFTYTEKKGLILEMRERHNSGSETCFVLELCTHDLTYESGGLSQLFRSKEQ